MALGLTQPLTEMSTRNLSWVVKAAGVQGWQPYHLRVPTVFKSGSLNLLEPSGPVQACNGTEKKIALGCISNFVPVGQGADRWHTKCTAVFNELPVCRYLAEARTPKGRFTVPHLLIYNLHNVSHVAYIGACCYETCLLIECREILHLPISCTHSSTRNQPGQYRDTRDKPRHMQSSESRWSHTLPSGQPRHCPGVDVTLLEHLSSTPWTDVELNLHILTSAPS